MDICCKTRTNLLEPKKQKNTIHKIIIVHKFCIKTYNLKNTENNNLKFL